MTWQSVGILVTWRVVGAALEAIYWVLSWARHRRCKHCYDDRFRPYGREDLKRVVGEGQSAHRNIIANLPEDMSFVNELAAIRAQRLAAVRARDAMLSSLPSV